MNYQSSYDCGLKPFVPDRERGYWSTPSDFIYVSLSLAFKMDYVVELGKVILREAPIVLVFPYVLSLALFIVPIMVLQSYLGQFSSSGFISAFRVAPAFKGIGYIALTLNIIVLAYYSIFATIPLFFLANSFRPTLPWSCEAMAANNATDFDFNSVTHICNFVSNSTEEESTFVQVPSFVYFSSQFGTPHFLSHYRSGPSHISWPLVVCSFVTWLIIAVILWRNFNAEKMGRFMRCSVLATFTLLLICLGRFLFLPGAGAVMKEFVLPHLTLYNLIITLAFMSTYGLGWGSILTLASFNRFRTNIVRHNWLICVGYLIVHMMVNLINSIFSSYFYESAEHKNSTFGVISEWQIFLSSGSVLADMHWPNLWCILFYGMLFMCGLMVLTTQLYVTLTSVFDEFISLRSRKLLVTLVFVGFLSVASIVFCLPNVIKHYFMVIVDSTFTTAGLNLMLLLVVLWVYGRVRFQRDIEFMLGTPFPTWKVYMMRFVTPLYLLVLLIFGIMAAIGMLFLFNVGLLLFCLFFMLIAWLFVPCYCVVAMMQSTGDMLMRFRRVCRPTDWYPTESEDRQRYEELLNNADMTQQLSEVQE